MGIGVMSGLLTRWRCDAPVHETRQVTRGATLPFSLYTVTRLVMGQTV